MSRAPVSRATADQPPATAAKVKVIGPCRAQTPAFVLVHLRVNSCRAVQEMADPGKNHHRSRSPRCAAEGPQRATGRKAGTAVTSLTRRDKAGNRRTVN